MKKCLRQWSYLACLLLLVLLSGCWPWAAAVPMPERRERTDFLMDTYVRILWYGDAASDAVVERAFASMREVESKMSVHLPTSEVTAINEVAGRQAVAVSSDTYQVVALALRVSELSQGAFDPTVRPLIDLWEQPVPTEEAIDRRLALVDYRQVLLNEITQEVQLLTTGMALDLSGIAKGFAVDRAIQTLREGGITQAVIDAGGDLYGLGTRADGTPWRIAVQHPRKPDQFLARLELTDASVVTSGDYQRYTEVDGVRYHHIFDPRTGWPASGLISTTVMAESAAWADALSTAVFVLGAEAGLRLIEELSNVEGLVVTETGEALISAGLIERLELLDW